MGNFYMGIWEVEWESGTRLDNTIYSIDKFRIPHIVFSTLIHIYRLPVNRQEITYILYLSVGDRPKQGLRASLFQAHISIYTLGV